MSKKEGNLAKSMDMIEKAYGVESCYRYGDGIPIRKISAISTSSIAINEAIGIGGVPRGRIIEVYGAESSGKSTLTLSMAREFQRLGEVVVYLDAEHAFDKEYAVKNGVDTAKLVFSQPDHTEQGLTIVERFIESGKVGLIIIDSIAAMPPKAELEGEAGSSHMGLQARLMSQTMRRLIAKIHNSKTTVVFINQMRKKIGVMFGSPNTTTSGEALKYYASIRIQLARTGTNKKGDEVLATNIKAKIVKNKTASPYKEAMFDIYFDSGICRMTDLINVAIERKVLVKSGAWYSYNEANIAQGLEKLRELLKTDQKLFDEIKEEIKK